MDAATRQARLHLPLTEKIALSKALLAQAMDRFGDGLRLAWTGGKDSTLLLWLTRQICQDQGRPMPRVLTIEEGDPFPEITTFLERLTQEWSLAVEVAANRDVLDRRPTLGAYLAVADLAPESRAELARLGFTGPGFPFDPDSPIGAQLLKVAPLAAFLRDHAVTALATGIRWDEHPARANETPFSPRQDPSHTRVHPLLHLHERDIWEITRGQGIPFCPLYAVGYRSLGTRSGTLRQSTLPAWEQDLEDGRGERAGREQDKETAMAQLRALGYM